MYIKYYALFVYKLLINDLLKRSYSFICFVSLTYDLFFQITIYILVVYGNCNNLFMQNDIVVMIIYVLWNKMPDKKIEEM